MNLYFLWRPPYRLRFITPLPYPSIGGGTKVPLKEVEKMYVVLKVKEEHLDNFYVIDTEDLRLMVLAISKETALASIYKIVELSETVKLTDGGREIRYEIETEEGKSYAISGRFLVKDSFTFSKIIAIYENLRPFLRA